MVALPDHDPEAKGTLLSQILRSLRRLRRRKLTDVAVEMVLKQRTYEHFEAGKGPLNIDRIHRFATLLGVDPFGILAALDIASPEFAVRTADNKFMTVFLMALQEFDARAQDVITRLDPYTLMDAFTEMFELLEVKARAQEDFLKGRNPGAPGDPEG